MKKILILGVNGFIGHHLLQHILQTTDWEVHGMDIFSERIMPFYKHPRFHFFQGDLTVDHDWIKVHVQKCDAILPLIAIATPALYVKQPLKVFELNFEAQLPVIRECVRHQKHLIFPSSSEVYGMCADQEFTAETSFLTYGPIHKSRWIYACSKQLLDRVIWAYGQEKKLNFTLFRPFNWIGSGLDALQVKENGASRVVTQFLGHILRAEAIQLVDGGRQRRCFTDIDDGIKALMAIIENPDQVASHKIYDLGYPENQYSIQELARLMLDIAKTMDFYRHAAEKVEMLEVSAEQYYGAGYQDIQGRKPSIAAAKKDLHWQPCIPLAESLRKIFTAVEATARC